MGRSTHQQVIKIKDLWYLQTVGGYEGPFDSAEEAQIYLQLTLSAEAARLEFAGLAFQYE